MGRFGVRAVLTGAFAVAAGGMLLLSGAGVDGSYLSDVLPGMLVAGVGLGVALVAVSVLTGARPEESGMLSGLNTTGHEIGGSHGVAELVSIASTSIVPTSKAGLAVGLGDAFLAAGIIAGAASVVALIILPSARSFVPKLALTPRVAVH